MTKFMVKIHQINYPEYFFGDNNLPLFTTIQNIVLPIKNHQMRFTEINRSIIQFNMIVVWYSCISACK